MCLSFLQGTYLGTLEDVNHLDLVGWVNTARYKWAEIMGREIKFKPATFYLGIADNLARVVEGQHEGHEAKVDMAHKKSHKERAELEEIRQEGERAEMAQSLGKGCENRPNGTPKVMHSLSGEGGPSSSRSQ